MKEGHDKEDGRLLVTKKYAEKKIRWHDRATSVETDTNDSTLKMIDKTVLFKQFT